MANRYAATGTLTSSCHFVAFVLFVAGTQWCIAAEWSAKDFDDRVAPILAEHCLSCHSGAQPKGMLNLSSHAAAKRGGESGTALPGENVETSLIWQKVASGEMPPESPLSDADRSVIRKWIENGGIWGTDPIDVFLYTTKSRAGYDWWSLQPIERPAVPQSVGPANSVDFFVQQRLKQQALQRSPRAGARTIIRRLSFDLLGLPPTPEEVESFQAAVRSEPDTAIRELIERLLASKHFGERWARHWLDVVRFGESQGFERDKLRENSWYYRDWVIHAINNDMPYDQFVRWQIAGDILEPKNPEAVTATGFLVAGPWDEVGQKMRSAVMKAVVRQDEIEDYVGTIGQAFLGLTVNCARCHDHKFDPISQKEYYRMSAAVAGVRHGSRNVMYAGGEPYSIYAVTPRSPDATHLLARGNPATKIEPVTSGGIAAIVGVNADFGLSETAADGERRKHLAAWITNKQNPLFARVIVNRLWHYHFGIGIVATPNDFGFNGGQATHPELLDYLSAELIDSDFRLKHIHRLIVSSEAYLQQSRYRPECGAADADNRLLWRKTPGRLDAETLRDTLLQVAGQLNPQLGGTPYRDFETHVHNSQFYKMVDVDSPDVYRRTVYRTWIRSGRNQLLDVFDCPDPSTTAPSRSQTTTPLQALTLMNNSFVLRMADRFAARVKNETENHADAWVKRTHALAFGRSPTSDEQRLASAFVGQHGLPAYCRVILNSNEFIHVD